MFQTERPGAPAAQVLPAIASLMEGLEKACHRISLAGAARRGERILERVDLLAIPKFDPATEKEPVKNQLWAMLEVLPGLAHVKRGELMRAFYFPFSPDDVVLVNVYTARPDTWGASLVHRTGSENFWWWIVGRLKSRGYAPVDGQIVTSQARSVGVPEEEDLFGLAGATPVDPKHRGRAGEQSAW